MCVKKLCFQVRLKGPKAPSQISCYLNITKNLKPLPQVTVPLLAKELQMTQPTARSALNNLKSIGVLEEVSGKKRDKIYIYRNYLNILEDGAEPFSRG